MPLLEILIWPKTYPELSWSYRETVCTAGSTLEGKPHRLYPVPLRYLPEVRRYSLWDVVRLQAGPNERDNRPESLKLLEPESLRIVRNIETSNGSWEERRRIVFADTSWHFGCVRRLQASQRAAGTSLGFVKVRDVSSVDLVRRSDEDRERHERKLRHLKSQPSLFGPAQKDLEFFGQRVRVRWHCPDEDCPGHTHQILDWGLGELGRREGPVTMLNRMESLCNLSEYDLGFFLGNFARYQQTFGVVGLWYPKHKHLAQTPLF